MSKYQKFIFKSYTFDTDSKILTFTYAYDDALTFTETFRFDFEHASYDESALDRACQLLFFMAGVSYYKAYLAPTIQVDSGTIDKNLAIFLSKTYHKGLGEFFYVNGMDPQTPIIFPVTTNKTLNKLSVKGSGKLIGLGGGKDSLVTVELLRFYPDISTWSLGHKEQLQPLVDRIALPHYWIEREWDKQLIQINDTDGYNGHVPISAILACVGTVTSILSGKQDVIVSNEHSANEETLEYRGSSINHQYSKSSEFEQDYQKILEQQFGESIRYYSLLRPFSELRICEMFAKNFDKYADVFSSCNRAFTHTSDTIFWCGQCPKCAFVFLALTPFVAREKLEKLFEGNVLSDKSMAPTYHQLLGTSGDKPLECVGEIKESRSAMRLAQSIYPELNQEFTFEIPDDYDWRTLASNEIPADIYDILQSSLQHQQ